MANNDFTGTQNRQNYERIRDSMKAEMPASENSNIQSASKKHISHKIGIINSYSEAPKSQFSRKLFSPQMTNNA